MDDKKTPSDPTVRIYDWRWGPDEERRPGLPWIGVFLLVFGGILLVEQAMPQYRRIGDTALLAAGLASLAVWVMRRRTIALYAGAFLTALALPGTIEAFQGRDLGRAGGRCSSAWRSCSSPWFGCRAAAGSAGRACTAGSSSSSAARRSPSPISPRSPGRSSSSSSVPSFSSAAAPAPDRHGGPGDTLVAVTASGDATATDPSIGGASAVVIMS
jgi:hypothetical protein